MHLFKVFWKATLTGLLLFGLTVTANAAGDTPVDTQAAGINLGTIEVLDLEMAQRIGLMQNPDLMAASERVSQARARVRQAQAAWRTRARA